MLHCSVLSVGCSRGKPIAGTERLALSMREVVQDLARWWEGRTVGMATVVTADRSAPRPPGTGTGRPRVAG